MNFDREIYYGNIIKGNLRSAINYVKQFPEQANLYNRFMDVFEHKHFITYEVDTDLSSILNAYQQYYRDVFYLCMGKQQAADKLRVRLAALLGITEDGMELCDLEQNWLVELFGNHGLHFMGGKTSGYYGPYIWRSTEKVSYEVALPDGVQTYIVKLLDGFLTRSWMDYLSFGEISSGGWTDGDGYINCVKSTWDFDSESFQVSLLKHEAQHAKDLARQKDMSAVNLEYRAKLVELIYSKERNLLVQFAQEADNTDESNGHATAASKILEGFARKLCLSREEIQRLPIIRIQTVAWELFEESNCA